MMIYQQEVVRQVVFSLSVFLKSVARPNKSDSKQRNTWGDQTLEGKLPHFHQKQLRNLSGNETSQLFSTTHHSYYSAVAALEKQSLDCPVAAQGWQCFSADVPRCDSVSIFYRRFHPPSSGSAKLPRFLMPQAPPLCIP
jgi:hypothetical protein